MLEGMREIRERVQTIQENLTSGILNYKGDIQVTKNTHLKDLSVGSEVLQRTLTQWNDLHSSAENNSKQSELVDQRITEIFNQSENHHKELQKVSHGINMIPKLVDQTKEIISQTKKIESLLLHIEKSLSSLQEIIKLQKVQEKQLEGRFQLAMHKEKKMSQLETLRGDLEREYNEEVRQVEAKKAKLLKERQKTFEEAFQDDLEVYKKSGNLNMLNINKSKNKGNVMSLEDVELEQDDSALNEMLDETQLPNKFKEKLEKKQKE